VFSPSKLCDFAVNLSHRKDAKSAKEIEVLNPLVERNSAASFLGNCKTGTAGKRRALFSLWAEW